MINEGGKWSAAKEKDSPSCSKVNWVHRQRCKTSCRRWSLPGMSHQSVDRSPWESGGPEVHTGGPCRSSTLSSDCSCIYRPLFSYIFSIFVVESGNIHFSCCYLPLLLLCGCNTLFFFFTFPTVFLSVIILH